MIIKLYDSFIGIANYTKSVVIGPVPVVFLKNIFNSNADIWW